MNTAIIIPALNPDEKLVKLVKALNKKGASKIIIVNDGSETGQLDIFKQVEKLENTIVLNHHKNLGKGAALKTAFQYCQTELTDTNAVVTADADGQHTPEDIMKIADEMRDRSDCIILGTRSFGQNTPTRSYMGNKFTEKALKICFGINIGDTQTGLRGIPAKHLEWLSKVAGKRYEYEVNMLIQAKHRGLEFIQVPIETVYFDNNSQSHFRAFRDAAIIGAAIIFGLVAKRHFSSKRQR